MPTPIQRVYAMLFSKVYPCYIAKAEKKNRTKAEVDQIISWLTGYDQKQLEKIIQENQTIEDFFQKAPKLNPDRNLIKGTICGVRIEEISEPIMKEIRYLDKLIDELAKGKLMAKILKTRCFGSHSPLYAEYHDNEWGIPVHDDQHLFEMLILEGAQAGLSWETVLKKRQGYRQAFHNFDIKKVAQMTDQELEKLTQNENIIRNRLKIYSTRQNAKIVLEIQKEFGSLDKYLWAFTKGKTIKNKHQTLAEIKPNSTESDAISKDLKKRGMKFIGTTIIYAYMQAIGMVDDHIASCWKRL